VNRQLNLRGKMMNRKMLFIPAGLWNLGIGFTGLFFHDFAMGLFFGAAAVTGDFLAVLMTRVVMLAIIIFGIGYLMAAYDPEKNHGVIILGLLSKFILFVIYTWYFVLDMATILAFLTVLGDLFWGLLFIWFLLKGDTVSLNAEEKR